MLEDGRSLDENRRQYLKEFGVKLIVDGLLEGHKECASGDKVPEDVAGEICDRVIGKFIDEWASQWLEQLGSDQSEQKGK